MVLTQEVCVPLKARRGAFGRSGLYEFYTPKVNYLTVPAIDVPQEKLTALFLTELHKQHILSSSYSGSGVLRMQKLRSHLLGAQGYQRFPLFNPGVGILKASLLLPPFWFSLLHANLPKQGPKGGRMLHVWKLRAVIRFHFFSLFSCYSA